MNRVAVVGLGPIGLVTAAEVTRTAGLELVGLVDIDPAKRGRWLNELLPEAPANSAVRECPAVVGSLDEVQADVAILSTHSKLSQVAPILRQAIVRKIAIVSSCEEMAFPRYGSAALADELDGLARQAGVALLGTGVNPGFVMDLLPVVLASMTLGVRTVRVIRRVDAATRRKPLQAKVGATMTRQRFEELARAGNIGHAGIGQSVALVAAGFGRTAAPGSVAMTLNPVIAEQPMTCLLGRIEPGQVCGMHNTGRWSGDGLSIDLDLTMAVGLPEPQDRIELLGDGAPLTLQIPGSTPGDSATVASLVNGARVIRMQRPGLLTMLDVTPMGSGAAAH